MSFVQRESKLNIIVVIHSPANDIFFEAFLRLSLSFLYCQPFDSSFYGVRLRFGCNSDSIVTAIDPNILYHEQFLHNFSREFATVC